MGEEEYIIVNKLNILKRLEQIKESQKDLLKRLKYLYENSKNIDKYYSSKGTLSSYFSDLCKESHILKNVIKNSIFLTPEIEKAFDAGQKHGEDNACDAEINLHSNKKKYIENFKIDL
jgi:hypothetical protein